MAPPGVHGDIDRAARARSRWRVARRPERADTATVGGLAGRVRVCGGRVDGRGIRTGRARPAGHLRPVRLGLRRPGPLLRGLRGAVPVRRPGAGDRVHGVGTPHRESLFRRPRRLRARLLPVLLPHRAAGRPSRSPGYGRRARRGGGRLRTRLGPRPATPRDHSRRRRSRGRGALGRRSGAGPPRRHQDARGDDGARRRPDRRNALDAHLAHRRRRGR